MWIQNFQELLDILNAVNLNNEEVACFEAKVSNIVQWTNFAKLAFNSPLLFYAGTRVGETDVCNGW